MSKQISPLLTLTFASLYHCLVLCLHAADLTVNNRTMRRSDSDGKRQKLITELLLVDGDALNVTTNLLFITDTEYRRCLLEGFGPPSPKLRA